MPGFSKISSSVKINQQIVYFSLNPFFYTIMMMAAESVNDFNTTNTNSIRIINFLFLCDSKAQEHLFCDA